MHDALFAQRGQLSPKSIREIAAKLGLSLIRFEGDLNSSDIRETIKRDLQDGEKAGVSGTPTIFINGQRYNGPVKLEVLKPVIEAELKLPASGSPAVSSVK